MIRLSEQNGGVFQNVDEVVEKVCAACLRVRRERRPEARRSGPRSHRAYPPTARSGRRQFPGFRSS